MNDTELIDALRAVFEPAGFVVIDVTPSRERDFALTLRFRFQAIRQAVAVDLEDRPIAQLAPIPRERPVRMRSIGGMTWQYTHVIVRREWLAMRDRGMMFEIVRHHVAQRFTYAMLGLHQADPDVEEIRAMQSQGIHHMSRTLAAAAGSAMGSAMAGPLSQPAPAPPARTTTTFVVDSEEQVIEVDGSIESLLALAVLKGGRVEKLIDELLDQGAEPDGDEAITLDWIKSEFDVDVTPGGDIVEKTGRRICSFRSHLRTASVANLHACNKRQFRCMVAMSRWPLQNQNIG